METKKDKKQDGSIYDFRFNPVILIQPFEVLLFLARASFNNLKLGEISFLDNNPNIERARTLKRIIRDFLISSFDFTSQEEKYQKNSRLE